MTGIIRFSGIVIVILRPIWLSLRTLLLCIVVPSFGRLLSVRMMVSVMKLATAGMWLAVLSRLPTVV